MPPAVIKYEMVYEEEDEIRTVITENTMCTDIGDLDEFSEDESDMSTDDRDQESSMALQNVEAKTFEEAMEKARSSEVSK